MSLGEAAANAVGNVGDILVRDRPVME